MDVTPSKDTSPSLFSNLLGLWLAVAAAALSAGLGLLEPVRAVGELLYDAANRAVDRNHDSADELLLVRAELRAQAFDDTYWLSLLQALLAAQPKRIAFMPMPEAVSPEFYARATESNRVVFGRTRLFEENDLGYVGLAHLPAAAEGYELPFGIVEAPPTRSGVYRSYQTAYPLGGRPVPSFALAAAFEPEDAAARRRYSRRAEVLVNFVTAGGPLPVVSADRILAGDWSGELARERIVIVGYVDDTYLPRLRTPLDRNVDRLSMLEAQGYAVLTLLRGAHVRTLPLWAVAILLLAVSISQLYIYRPLSTRAAFAVTLLMPIVYGVVAAFTLHMVLLWLPLVELALTQGIVWTLLLYRRAQLRKQRILNIAERVIQRVDQPVPPIQALPTADPWEDRVQLLNQTLELTRLIFLELSADGKQLREVKAVNCSQDDIEELRRDPTRSPYSALMEGAPTPLESAFFKSGLPGEQVYLVPLRSDDQLLGYWAFGIEAERAAALPLFAVCVHDYAAQLAELMLLERRRRQRQQRSWLRRIFSLDGDNAAEARLEEAHRALGSRLRMLEDLVQTLDTATAVFDLFGRARVINNVMVQLGTRIGINVESMDALRFTMAVARLSESEARRWLRNVGIHRAAFSTMTDLGHDDGIFALLRARPLLQRVDGELGEADAAPFRLRGIVFEIVDATALRRLYDLKEDVLYHARGTLPEDVQKVIRAAATLEKPNLPPGHRERLAKLTVEKMVTAVQQLVETERLLQGHPFHAGPACYALDPLPALQNGLASARAAANGTGVNWRVELGSEQRAVFAEMPALEGVFIAILQALVVSAPPRSELHIFSRSDPVQVLQTNRLTFWFVNERRGIDDVELQRWLAGEYHFGSEFRALRSAMQTVESWGGALECVAVAEAGITFRLRLRGFL